MERNWNGTKKLNTGTELERNEINGWNDYLERNGNLKGRSNGLVVIGVIGHRNHYLGTPHQLNMNVQDFI